MDKIVACQTCGLVQEADDVPQGSVIKCTRCHFQIFHRRVDSRVRTLAFSLAALILYIPANLYPIVTADYQGHHIQTTIFQGISSLFTLHQYFIGSLMFCTSMLTPGLKIIGLIFITLTFDWPHWKSARTWVFKIIRIIDPWNMLEVFFAGDLRLHGRTGRSRHGASGPRRFFVRRRRCADAAGDT
jgi:paraquat-inducible protein A